MKSIAWLSLLSVSLLALAPAAHATFLIDPTGGVSLSGFNDNDTTSDVDDGQLAVSLGAPFSFYGTNYSAFYVNVNGFLTPSNDGWGRYADGTVGALATDVPPGVIAPFYDDFYLDTSLGDKITQTSTGTYTAITYAISGQSDLTAGFESNFQAALITAPTLLKGNALLAGDIVLSYGALASTISGSNFSVGVAASSTNTTNAFGSGTGQFTTATSFLSNFNASTQALLFRYNSTTGRYAQSLITYVTAPVPEPASFAALGIGVLAVLRRRRR